MSVIYQTGREMTKPYTSGKYMADYTLEELRLMSAEITEDEKKDPFFKYYSEEMAPLQPEHKEAIRRGALPAESGFMPKDAAAILLNRDMAYPENGWCVLNNGVGFASYLIHQDGITDEMIANYRNHFCHTENRLLFYKIWHPHNHMIHFEDGIVENWGWGFCRQDMDFEAMHWSNLGITADDILRRDPDCLSFLAIGGTCIQLDRSDRKPWPMVMLQYIREVTNGRDLRVIYWNGLRGNEDGSIMLQVNQDREETMTEMKHMFLHGTGEYCNELKLIRRFWSDCQKEKNEL